MIEQRPTYAHAVLSLLVLIGLLVPSFESRAKAEDGIAKSPAKQDSPMPNTEPRTVRELIDVSMTWYQVFANAEVTVPAKPVVVLRWANNARGSQDGATLLYIHEGLPLAVACAYPWEKRLEFGFDSLSRQKVIGRHNGLVIWQPQESGVTFFDLPDAPVPEDTRPQRLRQMKALIERFEATMLGWKPDSSDREELRRLPTPIFRYSPHDGKILDGAVFAFATGTDPEVLLQLEAVNLNGTVKWQYGFSRRTSGALQGRLDKMEVWTAQKFPTQTDPQQSYFTVGIPLPPEVAASLTQTGDAKP